MQEELKDYTEIDLLQILNVLRRRALVIATAAIVCAVIFCLVSRFLITPVYEATSMMYINNSTYDSQEADTSVNASDLQASQSLVETCVSIIGSHAVYNKVVEETGVDYSYSQLSSMITAEGVNDTELLQITVESNDPEEAARLADAYMEVASETLMDTVIGSDAKTVDVATVPVNPSSPDVVRNTGIGLLLGMVAAMAVIILLELLNTVIRTEKELNEAVKGVPVLGVIPDFKSIGKSGGRGYGKKYGKSSGYASAYYSGHKDSRTDTEYEKNGLLTGPMPFVYKEAHKALRTNVMFSLPAVERGRIIGVTSADKGDGKSTSSVNVALSIAETGKKALLLDCDLRLSEVAERLHLKKTPGISNLLVGACTLDDAVQHLTFDGDCSMDVIVAGDFPPNPAELINSNQMKDMCVEFTKRYDYIIVDLPPVQIVSDALIMAEQLDGLILVVREGKSDREEIKSAVKKIEFVGGKLLGFIYANHYERPKSGHYGKYGKYGKYEYYKYGGYDSYGSYDTADKVAQKVKTGSASDGKSENNKDKIKK